MSEALGRPYLPTAVAVFGDVEVRSCACNNYGCVWRRQRSVMVAIAMAVAVAIAVAVAVSVAVAVAVAVSVAVAV